MSSRLERFFQDHFPIIRAKCARMLGDTEEAADVAQEAFLRLCASPVADAPPAARLRWIYETSTNLAIDRLRRRRLGIEVAGEGAWDDAPAEIPASDGVVAARQLLERLAAQLPAEAMQILILARLDEMTQEEIAEVTGLSSRTIRRVLARFDEGIARLERRHA